MNRFQSILSKSTSLFRYKTESLGIVAFGMGIILLVTKITGLFKLQVLTAVYSNEPGKLDLFYAANTIPEFIFTIIVIGGVNAALIPVLSQTSANEDKEKLVRVFSSITNLFFLVLFFISVIIFIFAPNIVELTRNVRLPNTVSQVSPGDYDTFVLLLRVLIISPLILCISSIFSSILQVKQHFWSTTLAPLFYNLGIIGSAILLRDYDKDLMILAYGVLVASILHFLVQVPAIIHAGIEYKFVLDLKDKYVKRAVKNTLPRIVSLTSDNIANMFQILVSFNLTQGSLTAFRNAISLRDLPSSIFGLSIAQSYFPKLAELAAKEDKEGLQKTFSEAIRIVLFWTIPITALFIVLRTPITQLTFGILGDSISFELTNLISYSLLFLSLGVILYSVLAVVIRTFFALNDSKTPTVVSLVSIFIELTLTYTLVNLFSNFDDSLSVNPAFIFYNWHNYFENGNSPAAIGGIALASTLAILLNLSLLIYGLNRKGVNFFYQSRFIIKKFISGSLALAIGLALFRSPAANLFGLVDTEKVLGVILTTFNVSIWMLLSYYLLEKLQKDEDIKIFENAIIKMKSYIIRVKNMFARQEPIGISSGN